MQDRTPSLAAALAVARQFLAEAEAVDHDRPVQVAASQGALTAVLRGLLSALDAGEPEDDAPTVDVPQSGDCPALDGQCTGEHCGDRGDPREPIHHGPEHGLNVSFADEPLSPFQLTQWEDEQPLLTVYAGGAWPDLNLAQVDELLLAFDEYTGALRVAREHLARAVAVREAQDAREMSAFLAGEREQEAGR